jgi:hypothetical protein
MIYYRIIRDVFSIESANIGLLPELPKVLSKFILQFLFLYLDIEWVDIRTDAKGREGKSLIQLEIKN